MIRRRVAVTGSTGFVGLHVVKHLAAAGYEVVGLCRSADAKWSGVEHDRRVVDFAQPASIDNALADVHAVIHLAGRAHVRGEVGDAARLYHDANVRVSTSVAQSAVRGGLQTFVYASSLKVYGDAESIDRATRAAPNDEYGRSKLESEYAIAETLAGSACALSVVRLPLVYGPGVKGNILRLYRAVAAGRPLPMGGLGVARSMLGITNLLAFLVGALEVKQPMGILLPSDGRDISPEQLVRLIAQSLDRPARLVPLPQTLLRLAGRLGDSMSRLMPWPLTSADVARLTRPSRVDSQSSWDELGLAPATSVEYELGRTADWFSESRRRHR